ncbi:MAG: phage integrase N-terminal SAM-like domain-containing protein [Actinobacteria bacterium]|nr:phage integrase N-terminal SAM-like domain-containing protein [Actinomycetota bacterium]
MRHYSIRTEESYLFWVRRFIVFHGKRHPRELGESQVGEFFTHLAVDRKVSASTQNQALNALVFLYKAVLERPLGDVGGVVRARRPQRLPVVLHVREVKALLRHLEGSHWLAACLMYGSGLRLMEALRLRVKDLDFERRAIMVRDGKGQKDRVVTLADELIVSLQRHLEGVRLIHTKDLVDGFGEVYLPDALERKYRRPDGNGVDSARPVLRPAGASAPFLSRRNGGSMCSRPASAVSIPAPARNGAITSTRARCRRP